MNKIFKFIVLAFAPFCIVFMVIFAFFMSGDYNERSVKMLCFFGSNDACVAVYEYAKVYEMQNNAKMADDFYKFACKKGVKEACEKLENK
nr:hypothetical protein [Campylobacter sp.]